MMVSASWAVVLSLGACGMLFGDSLNPEPRSRNRWWRLLKIVSTSDYLNHSVEAVDDGIYNCLIVEYTKTQREDRTKDKEAD